MQIRKEEVMLTDRFGDEYWTDVSGSMLMPRKMAGSEISTIVLFIEAMRTPSVVFESATHLYSTMQ